MRAGMRKCGRVPDLGHQALAAKSLAATAATAVSAANLEGGRGTVAAGRSRLTFAAISFTTIIVQRTFGREILSPS